jgi:hypothetical protein
MVKWDSIDLIAIAPGFTITAPSGSHLGEKSHF